MGFMAMVNAPYKALPVSLLAFPARLTRGYDVRDVAVAASALALSRQKGALSICGKILPEKILINDSVSRKLDYFPSTFVYIKVYRCCNGTRSQTTRGDSDAGEFGKFFDSYLSLRGAISRDFSCSSATKFFLLGIYKLEGTLT